MKLYHFLLAVLLWSGLCILLPGCAPEAPKPVTVAFTSTPAGATVTVNQTAWGVTPLQREVPPGFQGIARLSLAGYETTWMPFTAEAGAAVDCRLEPLKASALIVSKPSGAQVTVNGVAAGETPLVLVDLAPAAYRAELSKAGYAPLPVEWTIADGKPQLLLVEFETNLGTLSVAGEPEAADLFINGEKVGVTPYTGDFTEGEYKLKLSKAGFSDFTETVVLKRRETLSRHYELAGTPGRLELNSDPDNASVFLDGELRGTTPLVVENLAPGNYQLELSKAGFAMESTTVAIAPGQTTRLNGKLVLSTGGFDLTVEPDGVRIYLDNQELGISAGQTFQVRDLEPGVHLLRVAHKYADPEQQEYPLEIKKGEILALPVLKLWVANAKVTLRRDGEVLIGVVEDGPADAPLRFSPARGIRIAIQREKIQSVEPLQ